MPSTPDTVPPQGPGGHGTLPLSARPAPASLPGPRVTAPDLPRGYVRRPELLERIGPAGGRRIIVLQAPGGFGKTTLLADLCNSGRERGMLAAWLTLAEDDTLDVFGVCLVHAFGRAGLDLGVLGDGGAGVVSLQHPRRAALLSNAIESHAAPCLLILDDMDRLADRETVEAVNRLVRDCPGNLRIAVACRSNPGPDINAAVLAGQGVRLGVEELRFSMPEVARCFGFALERDELHALHDRTEGWPAALQLERDARAAGPGAASGHDSRGDRDGAANLPGARVLRHLPRADRDFLLDLALFDRIDPALVDEALDTRDTKRRIAMLPGLDGLMQPIARGSDVLRLHPVLRDYCVAQRRRETPDRCRRVRSAIARALSRRNLPLPAVQSASAAGDDRLVNEIVERAAGLRLLSMEGLPRLRAIARSLTPAVLEAYPRLGLLRCIVLLAEGKPGEASALFQDVARRTPSFTADREGGDDRRLRAERVLMQGLLAGFGCLPVGGADVQALMAEMNTVADDEDVDPALRGLCDVVLCAFNHQRARFDGSRQRELAAKAHFARCGSRTGEVFYHFHAGIAAMAQGHVPAAASHYARGRRILKQHFPEDHGALLIGDVLAVELDLERNRMKAVEQRLPDPARLQETGAWLDVYAAAYAVAVEAALVRRGAAAALAVLDAAQEHARSQDLASVVRYLSALRVSLLVAAGHLQQAEEAWLRAGLPDAAADMTDLNGAQSWREMEAVTGAGIWRLAARGDLDAARELADRLCETAAARGLARTLMRGLAASMVLEHWAGAAARAAERLAEFLVRVRTTDYTRPLVRERAVSVDVLRRLTATAGAADVKAAAESMLAQLGAAEPFPAPAFTPREIDVLTQLAGGARDREIAARLGLGEDGVRYHLKNIYRKTNASGRNAAVQRVRELGVVP